MIDVRTAKARADAKGQQCVNSHMLLGLVAQLGILPPSPMLGVEEQQTLMQGTALEGMCADATDLY